MPWGFVIASDALDPRTLTPDEVDRRLRARCDVEKLRFYDGTIHQAILALPRYMRAILEEQGQVLYDAGPPLYRSIDYAITIG
jgi:spermidine synthase